jgi:C4-type Zn-finger protein
MDEDLKMLQRLIKFADKEIEEQNKITKILIDQFNNKIFLDQFKTL